MNFFNEESRSQVSRSMRVALFFDHTVPHTTGHYVRRGLEQFCEVHVYFPKEARQLKTGDYDLFLCVDDSSHQVYLSHLTPSVLWILDTHMTFLADTIMARRFDFVFVNNKQATLRFRKHGIPKACWLPVACDPDIHGSVKAGKIYDVAFIGSDGWGQRRRLIRRLRREFPVSFIGRAPHTSIGTIYSQARVVFNCSISDDLNMRTFEALCSGSCLVSNLNVQGLTTLFIPNEHLLTYETDDEAMEAIKWCLQEEDKRERIALSGRTEVLAKHTYWHRARVICETIQKESCEYDRRRSRALLGDAAIELVLKSLNQFYKIDYCARQWFMS